MKSTLRMVVACSTCLAIAACGAPTAEMLARPGGPDAPTSGTDFGLVRYLTDGSPADVQTRADDANRQMSQACGGKYRILDKGSRNEVNLQQGGRFGRQVWATDENYVYIKYVCTP